MVYLGLAILCSAAIALIFKVSEAAGANRYAVCTANYVAAVAVSGGILLYWGVPPVDSGSLRWAVLCGLGAGVLFFLGFVFYQKSVKAHGASMAGSFAKLGILVPMSLSLALWRELPSSLQWCGIGLAVFSILLVNWPFGEGFREALKPALLLLFLFGGLSEFSNKVFQRHGLQEHKAVFLGVTFGVALVASLATTLALRRPVTRRDLLTGLLVGVPNLFSSFFLISALAVLPAAVVFPVYGAGTIVIIVLIGTTLLGERLRPREAVGVLLIVASLVLVNL